MNFISSWKQLFQKYFHLKLPGMLLMRLYRYKIFNTLFCIRSLIAKMLCLSDTWRKWLHDGIGPGKGDAGLEDLQDL